MITLPVVRRAPVYWRYLPYFTKIRGLLFLNSIYLRADIFDDIHSNSPKPVNMGVLIHEQTHFERMREQGMLRFGIKYLLSSKVRFEEELAAITEQMRYLKSKGEGYDIERASRALSSIYYLWCVTYDIAYRELSEKWEML